MTAAATPIPKVVSLLMIICGELVAEDLLVEAVGSGDEDGRADHHVALAGHAAPMAER